LVIWGCYGLRCWMGRQVAAAA
jgi:hypothetical protein